MGLTGKIYHAHGFVLETNVCPPGYGTQTNYGVYYLRKGDTARVLTDIPELVFGYTHTVFSGFKINVGR